MNIKSYEPTAAHRACLADLKGALGKHPELSPPEMLALASQLVGTLIALQDQTTVTPEMAMRLVEQNIVEGNKAALSGLRDTKGSA